MNMTKNVPQEADARTPIVRRFVYLEHALIRLQESSSALRERLEPVLAPRVPKPEKEHDDGPHVHQTESPIAEALRQLEDIATSAQYVIDDILDRVELGSDARLEE